MGLFKSKPKKPPEARITEQDRAILKLKGVRDQLQIEKKRIEAQIESQKLFVRQLLAEGKRDKAKLLLARKRFLETRVTQTDGQLGNLMDQIGQLEDAQIQLRVVDALKTGNEALSAIHTVFSLDDVERLMADTADAVQYQREIDTLISGTFTPADRSEIERELEELLTDDQEALAALPNAPSHEPQAAEAAQPVKQRPFKQAVAAM